MPAAHSGLVRDIMTVGVDTCFPDTPVFDLARLMLEKGIEAVVVLSSSEEQAGHAARHAIGVVSQDELIKAYSRADMLTLKAEDIMRDGVLQVPADIPYAVAAQIMQDLGVRALFLMHHSGGIEYPVGVITYKNLLRNLGARNLSELSDLGIQAERESPVQTFIRKREQGRQINQNRLK